MHACCKGCYSVKIESANHSNSLSAKVYIRYVQYTVDPHILKTTTMLLYLGISPCVAGGNQGDQTVPSGSLD